MVAQEVNRISESMQGAMERPAELVKEYPISSMLLLFGVGIGVGALLAQAVTSSTYEMFEPEPSSMQRWGKQAYRAMEHVVPDMLSRSFQR